MARVDGAASGGKAKRWSLTAASAGGRPDSLLHRIPLVLALLTAVVCVLGATSISGADEHTYRYIGYAWFRAGDLPYRDAFENKPPGIYVLWGLVWLIADGSPFVGRLLAIVANCLSAGLVGGLSGRIWQRQVGVTTGALFFCAVSLWQFDFPFADTESFGTLFALGALYLVWPGQPTVPSPFRAVLAGLLCGVAVLFKQVFFIESILVVAFVLSGRGGATRRAAPGAATLAAAVLPGLVCLLYFYTQNALGEFFDVAIGSLGAPGTMPTGGLLVRLGTASSKALGYIMLPLVLVVLALGSCGASELQRDRHRRVFVVCLLWVAAILSVICVQGRGYGHQFRQALVPLCLLAAGGLPGVGARRDGGLSRERRWRRLTGCLLVMAMGMSLLSNAVYVDKRMRLNWEIEAGPARVGPGRALPSPEAVVGLLTEPDDRIWCYPRWDIYARARRLSATRYFMPVFLSRPEARADVFQSLRGGHARLVLIDWVMVERGVCTSAFERADRPAFHAELSAILEECFVLRGIVGASSVYECKSELASR